MIKVILILIFSALIIYKSFGVIEFINSKDKEKIIDKKSSRALISGITSLLIGCLYLKYSLSITFIKYFFLVQYLVITGYIDSRTKNVYDFISAIFAVIGFILMETDLLINNVDLLIYLLPVLSHMIIGLILVALKFMGWGDVGVLVIVALYIGNPMSLMVIFMSFALAGIIATLKLIAKKINIGDREALCPYIALSTCIILLVL